jgi:hypothetical protein
MCRNPAVRQGPALILAIREALSNLSFGHPLLSNPWERKKMRAPGASLLRRNICKGGDPAWAALPETRSTGHYVRAALRTS